MKTQVECKIEEVTLENDAGREVDGVEATCSQCGHQTESFGTGEKSVRRCLALMQEECPEDPEDHYYVAEGDGDSRLPDPIPKKWWEK